MDLVDLSIIKTEYLIYRQKHCQEMFKLFITQKAPFPL